jgi:hypothetical protein
VVTVHGVFASLQSSRGHDYCSQWPNATLFRSRSARPKPGPKNEKKQGGFPGRNAERITTTSTGKVLARVIRKSPHPDRDQQNRASFASQACVVTHTSERFHASIPTMWAGDIDFVCSNARIWLDDVVNLRCCRQGTAG